MKTIIIEACVRYWEDATVNGVEDTNGDLIPLRKGDCWCPIIDLESGTILDWPNGTEALIHYKVCDAGEYWIGDESGNKVSKYEGDYVPRLLSPADDNGYGDYIIMEVDGSGEVTNWNLRAFDDSQWKEQP